MPFAFGMQHARYHPPSVRGMRLLSKRGRTVAAQRGKRPLVGKAAWPRINFNPTALRLDALVNQIICR
jgi:hypothetical protein